MSKTCGSRVTFINRFGNKIDVHRPHPSDVLKGYQVKKIRNNLEKEGLI